MKIIELLNVSKKYHHKVILSDVNYCFEQGKCYLVIGNNGSGKTTLIKSILGLVRLNYGEVIYQNKKIAYVPEKIIFPDYIDVYSFLFHLGMLAQIPNKDLDEIINSLLKEWKLDNAKNKLIKDLSKGMMQKVLIIQALLKDEDIYIFDEPLNGLDLEMQNKFLSLITSLRKRCKTVIIISHYPNLFLNISNVTLSIEDGKIYEKINIVSF